MRLETIFVYIVMLVLIFSSTWDVTSNTKVAAVEFSGRKSHGPRSYNARSSPETRGSGSDDGDDFYSILGVDKNSTPRDIKAAYRKKAVTMHPDKGGDAEDFKKLVEAYETLSDETKRKMYDRFGKAGVQQPGFRPQSDDSESFRDIFRGFGGFGFQMPVVYNLELTLEDIYTGREILVNIFKSQVTVKITPGMLEGTELGAEVGGRQVIFVLQQRRHSVFTRKKNDLLLSIKVPLIDALLGFEQTITLLDGSEVLASPPPGRVTAKDDALILEGLGMPIPEDRNGKRGDLYVHVDVDMPQALQLSAEDKAVLQRIFGVSSSTKSSPYYPSSPAISSQTKQAVDGSVPRKRYTMKPVDIRRFGRKSGASTSNQQSRFSSFSSTYPGDDDEDEGEGFTSFSSFFFR